MSFLFYFSIIFQNESQLEKYKYIGTTKFNILLCSICFRLCFDEIIQLPWNILLYRTSYKIYSVLTIFKVGILYDIKPEL